MSCSGMGTIHLSEHRVELEVQSDAEVTLNRPEVSPKLPSHPLILSLEALPVRLEGLH